MSQPKRIADPEAILLIARAHLHLSPAMTFCEKTLGWRMNDVAGALSVRAAQAVLRDLLAHACEPEIVELVFQRIAAEAREIDALGPCVWRH